MSKPLMAYKRGTIVVTQHTELKGVHTEYFVETEDIELAERIVEAKINNSLALSHNFYVSFSFYHHSPTEDCTIIPASEVQAFQTTNLEIASSSNSRCMY